MKIKIKRFDCVQMKRRGAELVREKIKGKSPLEQLQYWKQATEQLKRFQRKAKRRK